MEMIQDNKGQPMRLLVFDTHTLRTRETVLTPDEGRGVALIYEACDA